MYGNLKLFAYLLTFHDNVYFSTIILKVYFRINLRETNKRKRVSFI